MQLTNELLAFKTASASIMTEVSARAMTLPANTVQVWPGGATFSTIQAAINSIGNAGPTLQYQVAVGPGTYNENVTMKDYVFIAGAGSTQTIVTAPGQQSFASGVINSASNCGISNMQLAATGGSWGSCPLAIKICGQDKFHISGIIATTSDNGNAGNNIRGISNNTGGTGNVIIGQSKFIANATDPSGVSVAIEGFNQPLTYFIELTDLLATGNAAYGLTTVAGCSATITDSTIQAATWALYNSDQMSPITANQCKIIGPVSAGVTVNN